MKVLHNPGTDSVKRIFCVKFNSGQLFEYGANVKWRSLDKLADMLSLQRFLYSIFLFLISERLFLFF